MSIVLKKQVIYQLLFFACVAVPYLNIYEATFGVWALAVLITIKNRYSFTLLHYVSCFVAILLIALVSSFYETDIKTYDFLRDFAYLLKPILGLILGYQLFKGYFKNPLIIFVNTGFAIAVIHLGVICYSVAFLRITSMHILREHSGYFSDFEVYAIIILIFRKQFQLEISEKKYRYALAVLAISIIFYLARTNFIQFGVLYLALKGYFVLNRRSIKVLSIATLVIALGYTAVYIYNPDRNAKGLEAFLFKIKNSPIEPFKTRVNKDDWKDFNDNYRSYETILTLKQVPQEGTGALFFGEGLGPSMALKRKVWLQSSLMRYIPFLHNGFMTILLKSGIVGILILTYSIILLFRNRKSQIPQVININYVLVGTGLYLIISYWVFMGLYFTVDTKSVVIGFLLCYREHLIKSNAIKAAT